MVLKSKLLTAEEYGQLPDDGRWTELVRGNVVEMIRPYLSHGYYLCNIGSFLNQFVKQHQLGRWMSADPGIITRRNPDTVRRPDLAFYGASRIPRDPPREKYWPASPELVFEIRCPGDRNKDVIQKVADYLNADVLTVVVIDPEKKRVEVYSADQAPLILNVGGVLSIPDVLPGFEVPVQRLFE